MVIGGLVLLVVDNRLHEWALAAPNMFYYMLALLLFPVIIYLYYHPDKLEGIMKKWGI